MKDFDEYKKNFDKEVSGNIQRLEQSDEVYKESVEWMNTLCKYKYAYNFSWLGRPAIQMPNDVWALQELIWKIKPDLIIETGIAHGGSLIVSASLLSLIDICDASEKDNLLDLSNPKRMVMGIDIDIRKHNRFAIESHPMSKRIRLIEGSSIDEFIVKEVKNYSKNFKNIMVLLDSNHTHNHVLKELNFYSPLVSKGSYIIVYDTCIEDMDDQLFLERPWGKGNSPKTAVYEFLKNNKNFKIDKGIAAKLQITVAQDGFLKKLS